ncbi:response regulator [Occultella glacieicola]|uniref:Response regulator n=1 Tax=Occultella glacieicola TaxID=2518684 RepID=A0ABY2E8D5_9MICO|nr:response regulator [Occultella glacieicola]TDE94141.1 response regulator [Occultella glacieicola]
MSKPQVHALVIEDDDDIRRLLEVVLGQAGYEVTSSATGADGVRLARATPPDLITLDVGLPDTNGYAVAETLRTFYGGHLVMLSARAEAYDAEYGMQVGADAYLTKPFRPRAFREALASVVAEPARGVTAT